MLHEFLTTNRAELIDRCRTKVAKRSAPKATPKELEHGVPVLIDQLIKTLKVEQKSGPAPEAAAGAPPTEIGNTAMLHGRELLKQGFTVDQVVHDYGDLCQAVTELASEDGAPIEVDEFRTLNRCLDDAIAGAVTEFTQKSDSSIAGKSSEALDVRLLALAHEMQSHIKTATLAIAAIKVGHVGLKGATGAILDLSLISLQTLIDRSIGEVSAGINRAGKDRVNPH